VTAAVRNRRIDRVPAVVKSMALAAVLAALPAGCAAPGTPDGAETPPDDRVASVEPASDRPVEAPALADGQFPRDFMIDVTVLLGPGAPEQLSAEDHQAKYILLPDGSLHSDVSPFITMSTRPGRTRWLYEDQVQLVWSRCAQFGFTNESNANGPPNPDLMRAARGERLAIITLRAEGRTWTYVRRAAGADPTDAAVARLIRLLALLSWMPDFRPEDLMPERYDFGPDPYAAYREIRARTAPLRVR
jgi:hypothetical protein